MTRINVYDDSAEKLEQLAEQLDTSVADVIEQLLDFANELE